MHSYFLVLALILTHEALGEDCPSHWTRRGSSSILVQFRESEPNQYRPVSVIFTPNQPVPENLTEILIIPARASHSCQRDQCDPRGDFDLVFFTKSLGRHFVKSELALVQCEEVESCTIPEPTLRPPALGEMSLVIPSIKPSTGPSKYPSFGPTVHPSVHPSMNPSTAPSFEPSKGPTTDIPTAPPSKFPVLKMRLMLEEKVLWRPQSIHLLKNLVSDMYDVPVDSLQLSTVTKSDEDDGVTVEMEIRDHHGVDPNIPIDISFEDQVFITGRLKHSAVLEAEGELNLIPLDVLKRTKQFNALNEIICGSISEHFHDVKIHDVKQFGSQYHLTIEATLQSNLLSFELGELEPVSVHRRTMLLPIAKHELFTQMGLDRLKIALSKRLPGVNTRDIKVISLERETDDQTSVDLDISTDNPNILDHLTHEDEVYIAGEVLRGPAHVGSIIGFTALTIVVIVFVVLFIIFMIRKKDDNYEVVLEPGAALLGEGALLPIWLPQRNEEGEREGELSDVSDEEQEASVSRSEGRPAQFTEGSDIILSPVPGKLSDEEIECEIDVVVKHPSLAVSTQLTDDEAS